LAIRVRSVFLLAIGLTLLVVRPVEAQAPAVTAPTPERETSGDHRPAERSTVDGTEVTVIADQIEELGAGLLVATGSVEVTREGARLLADRVEMNRETGDTVATGHVIFYDGADRLTADRIDYNIRTGTGVVYTGKAQVPPYYRLSGERFERTGESTYRVQRGTFTTCEDDPPAWSIKIGEATADLNDFVFGENASFWVKGIPLIPWFPFFGAPIRRERQTGFLFPRFGTASSKGFTAEIPFFWAISDRQDLTASLLAYERRGEGFTADYRYIVRAGHDGSVRGFLLEETQRNGADRGWGAFRHDWAIAPGLSFKADARAVTDDGVLRDYGDGLHQRSEQRVESNVFLTRNWNAWSVVGNAFWYQDLTTRRPVELDRLPDLAVQGVRQPVPGLPGVLAEFDAGAVHFVREVGSDGSRVDVHPRLSRPISLWGLATFTPFAGGRVTAYDRTVTGSRLAREGIAVEETTDDPRVRRLVESGADIETVVSRPYTLGGWQGIDTLRHAVEVHANYTRITGEEMNKLPSWTDVDQIEKTSRVEYSLTNRVFAHTIGIERSQLEMFRLVLTHSFDLRENRDRSGDVVADLLVDTGHALRFRGNVTHDTHGRGLQDATGDVSLTLTRFTASIGTRFNEPSRLNFLQGALVADVMRNVAARVSTNWDLRANRFVENRFAIDFKFQCYAFTVEYVDRSGVVGQKNNSEFRFAVNLLGIGGPISTSLGLGALSGLGGSGR
jgi:LPS-assembly protein